MAETRCDPGLTLGSRTPGCPQAQSRFPDHAEPACPGLPLARGCGFRGRGGAARTPRAPRHTLGAGESGPGAPCPTRVGEPALPCGLRAASQGKGSNGVSRTHKSGVRPREGSVARENRVGTRQLRLSQGERGFASAEVGGCVVGRREGKRKGCGAGWGGLFLPHSSSRSVIGRGERFRLEVRVSGFVCVDQNISGGH